MAESSLLAFLVSYERMSAEDEPNRQKSRLRSRARPLHDVHTYIVHTARTPATAVAGFDELRLPHGGAFSTLLVVVAPGQNTVHVLHNAKAQLTLLIPDALSTTSTLSLP